MSSIGKGLLTGLLTGLLGLLLYLTPAGTFLETHLGLDLLFNLRGPLAAPESVVVVSIDKASARELNLPARPVHWPRSLHAEAINILGRRGATAIGFDVLFRQEGNDADSRQLAAAIAGAGNVVLFQYLDQQRPAARTVVETLVPPVSPIGESALALAPFPLPKVPAKISRYWLFKDSVGGVPTMPAVMLQLYLLDVYPQWRALLVGLRPELQAQLPASADALRSGQALVPFMIRQRQWLTEDPRLAERLAERLAARIDDGTYRTQTALALGALVRLYSGEADRLVNYYGPARTIQTLPYHQLLDSDGDPALLPLDLAGKAVFIGLSEPLQLERIDTFYTPFSRDDGVDVSGVEIMAGAFANLLGDHGLRAVPGFWVLLLFLGLPVIAGLLPRVVGTPMALGGVGLLSMGLVFLSMGLFVEAKLWLPYWIPLTLLLPIALFISFFWKYLDTQREKERIRKAFGYYLPEPVIDEIAENFAHPDQQRQRLLGTCLATDAARYTTLAERLDPERLARLMDQYYAGLFTAVRGQEGVVSDVVGDAMMAFWTELHNGEHHPRLACAAALAISELSPDFVQDGEHFSLPTRIGIHSGEMLVGNIGALDHYEYRAVGDITNTAHRLQALARALGLPLLVSDETLTASGHHLHGRFVGDFLLAGKTRPVSVHTLLTAQQAAAWPAAAATAFAEALALFRGRHWRDAAAAFRELSAIRHDPVAEFYAQQTGIYMDNEPADGWHGEVQVLHK